MPMKITFIQQLLQRIHSIYIHSDRPIQNVSVTDTIRSPCICVSTFSLLPDDCTPAKEIVYLDTFFVTIWTQRGSYVKVGNFNNI